MHNEHMELSIIFRVHTGLVHTIHESMLFFSVLIKSKIILHRYIVELCTVYFFQLKFFFILKIITLNDRIPIL